MDISFLSEYIEVGVLGICLCVGYVIKHSLSFIPNRFIPLIMLLLGAVINIIANWGCITVHVVLSGMFSGLASTGIHEAFRNLIKGKNNNS